jgi:hypothetical protein
MSYLADLAEAQDSADRENTDVHGICEIAQSESLFLAVSAETATNPPEPPTDLFDDVDLLSTLIHKIVHCETGKRFGS